jgi:hypothetical protein
LSPMARCFGWSPSVLKKLRYEAFYQPSLGLPRKSPLLTNFGN